MGRWCHLLWAVVAVASTATFARGQCETGKVVPSDGLVNDFFGAAVDLSGGWLIAGAPGRDFGVGAAYVYERMGSSWVERALLLPSNPVGLDDFGRSVAITGLYAAVGMPKADIGPNADIGLVQVYRWSGTNWILEGFDNQPGVAASSEFGTSVSLFGDALLAGASNSDGVNTTGQGNSGSAYVYRRNASFNRWDLETTFTASDAAELDTFGAAVKLHGNWAFVGAPADKDPNISASNTVGAVYVFLKQGANWLQVQKLTASDAAAQTSNRLFGRALDCDGNVLIVGERQGQSAYVFRRVGNTWAEEAILKKPAVHGSGIDQFATAVAIEGDLALVGAPLDDDNGLSNSGTVFAYRRIGGAWTAQPLIHATDAAANKRMGVAVAIEGTEAAAGALQPIAGPGAVYALSSAVITDCNGNGADDACEVSQNPGLDGNGDGIPDECVCTTNGECNDNNDCTVDTCDLNNSKCVLAPTPGVCVIGGQCYEAGTVNPMNLCQVCNPAITNGSWAGAANGVACEFPGNPCISTATCQGGFCVPTYAPAGTICGGQPPFPCYLPNVCDSFGTCVLKFAPAGTVCGGPSGIDCQLADSCNGHGTCGPTYAPAGAPCGDPATTECTLPDTCNAAHVCQPNHRAENLICSGNGIYCDGVQRCASGICAGPVENPCPGPAQPYCLEATRSCGNCLTDEECDDQNECTADGCSNGNCTHPWNANGTLCGDAYSDTCNQADSCLNGSCRTNLAPNGTICSDVGEYCTGERTCLNGLCGQAPYNPCTTAAAPICDEENDRCVQCLDDTACTNPTFPFCDLTSGTCKRCVTDLHCASTNPCVTRSCINFQCFSSALPNGTSCGDPSSTDCTLPDTCLSGSCASNHMLDTTHCTDDGDPCTTDWCQQGVCAHASPDFAVACGPFDCNCNFMLDTCEVANSTVEDCNSNGWPDECEAPDFSIAAQTSTLTSVTTLQLHDVPYSAGNVFITATAIGDLGHTANIEYVNVRLNGTYFGRLFDISPAGDNWSKCSPNHPNRDTLVVSKSAFNQAVFQNKVVFTFTPTSAIGECTFPSSFDVRVVYDSEGMVDCNRNSIPDDCELAEGHATDCNANGVPDDCEPDCNQNQVADACDLMTEIATDCDNDSRPDGCMIPSATLFSGRVTPFGVGAHHTVRFDNPPIATGNARLTVKAFADVSSSGMIIITINGVFYDDFWNGGGGTLCRVTTFARTIPMNTINSYLQSGSLNIALTTTTNVEAYVCNEDYIEVTVDYPTDCNHNNILDECELVTGVLTDSSPADGFPDQCIPLTCGPVGEITPTSWHRDARQPHELQHNGVMFGGLDSIMFTVGGTCQASGFRQEYFRVHESPPSDDPIAIGEVTYVGNVVEVGFSRPQLAGSILKVQLPQELTNVSYHPYLPGDVSGDRVVSFYDAYAHSGTCLAEYLPYDIGLMECDIDRSGNISSEDLTRLLDLLNGAGDFEVWDGRSVPFP